jgi:hypothetical protein
MPADIARLEKERKAKEEEERQELRNRITQVLLGSGGDVLTRILLEEDAEASESGGEAETPQEDADDDEGAAEE